MNGRLGRFRLALLAVTLLGGSLRLWGLWYGLPHPLARPDEEIVVGHALEISLPIADPGSFPYPTLVYFRDPVRDHVIRRDVSMVYPYPDLVYYTDGAALWLWRQAGQLIGAYQSADDFVRDIAVRQRATQYRIARAIGALWGALTPLAACAGAWFAYRRRSIALLAALLVSVNYLHARESHYATVDTPMTLLVTLALAFALRAATTSSRRDVLVSAGFAGLSASAKFNGAVVILSTVVATGRQWFSSAGSTARRRTLTTLVIAAVIMAAAFVATSPLCVIHAKTVMLGLQRQRGVLFSSEGVAAWRIFLAHTLPGAFGWIGFGAVLAGLGRAVWKHRVADLILLAFIVPLFASMAGMTWVLPRYPLPLIPALSILAAEVSVAVLPSMQWGWIAALVLGLCASPFRSIVAYDRLASVADTRQLASEWVNSHLPQAASIVLCRGYGAPVVNDNPDVSPAFATRVVDCTLDGIRVPGAQYVIVHTHPFIPLFGPTSEAADWLRHHATPVATFDPFRSLDGVAPCFYPGDAFYLPYCRFDAVERGGPIVTIWAVQ